jgi:hypothetical protein
MALADLHQRQYLDCLLGDCPAVGLVSLRDRPVERREAAASDIVERLLSRFAPGAKGQINVA